MATKEVPSTMPAPQVPLVLVCGVVRASLSRVVSCQNQTKKELVVVVERMIFTWRTSQVKKRLIKKWRKQRLGEGIMAYAYIYMYCIFQ